MNVKKIIAKKFPAAILALTIAVQISLVFHVQKTVINNNDGIFTFTLANTSYSYNYIDHMYKRFPVSENGWLSGKFLRSNYIVGDNNRFDYGAVYFHQRLDNHPLLYYSLVHTICSIFFGTYSVQYALVINLFGMLGIDCILILLFRKLFRLQIYALVPVIGMMLVSTFLDLFTLPRMYTLLAFMTIWYQYLQLRFQTEKHLRKSDYITMLICVFLGTQTHYYLYVYAFFASLITAGVLLKNHQFRGLFNYICAGISGICLSVVLFPWVVWHILYNQMKKHSEVSSWSLQGLKEYFSFVNSSAFNDHFLRIVIVFGLIAAGLKVFSAIRHNRNSCLTSAESGLTKEYRIYLSGVLFTGAFYSVLIFTLDGGNWYYETGMYLPILACLSAIAIIFGKRVSACLISLFNKSGSNIHIRPYISTLISLCVSLFIMMAVLGTSAVQSNIRSRSETFQSTETFRNIPYKYQNNACIYIEEGQDNLFSNLLLDVSQYAEFKKISADSYRSRGLTLEDIAGRTSSGPVIIYIPSELSAAGIGGQTEFLATNGSFNIYLLEP